MLCYRERTQYRGAVRPLRELQVHNFRSLRDIKVALQPLTVLVGPNGAGKSNLLDVIRFLGDSVRSDLGPAVSDRGGFDRLAFRGTREDDWIRIEVKANVTTHSSPTAEDEYSLAFKQGRGVRRNDRQPVHFLRREETFKFKRTEGRGRRITIGGDDVTIVSVSKSGSERVQKRVGLRESSLGLTTLPKLADNEGGLEIAKIADLFAELRVFDVNVDAARLPARDSGGPLESDASNLADFLWQLSATDQFEDLLDDAREIVPGLLDIGFEPVGGSLFAHEVVLKEAGLRDRTSLADASYGTVRALALLALLYDPAPPQMTCVEEIDHGLHPHALDLIVERVREASTRTQFLVASHSPTLVNRLRASELVVCERSEDGSSLIPAISASTVRQMEKAAGSDLQLGELWFAGTLRG